MAVDAQRGNFHINRITPQEIGLLMSAQSYRPEVTEALNRIRLFPKLESLQDISLNTISPGPHPVYTESGYSCLKTRNVHGLLADLEPSGYADVSGIKQLSKVQVANEDLLINLTGAGSIGRVSIYFGENKPITNQHIARISISEHADPAYVCVFLRTWWGERALEQGIAGSTGQLNMVNDHVRSIPIPLLAETAQKYIGNKVRQAETLRAWGKELGEKIAEYFYDRFAGINTRKTEKIHSRVTADGLTTRINAEFYAEEYRQVERGLMAKFSRMTTIGKVAPVNKEKSRPISDCIYFEIGDVCTSSGKMLPGTPYQQGTAPNNAQRQFNLGDIAISTRRPNRGAVAVVEEGSQYNYYSVFLVRLVPESLSLAYWLKEYLRHDIGKQLLLQRCTWTTYPVISEDDIQTIPIPVLEKDWEDVGDWSKSRNQLLQFSTLLTTAAKLLVEALIEGKITEQDLISAQQALEKGDPSLDRQILSRLTTTGIDNNDDPLFPDLDQLYQLLEQATDAGSEV